MGQAFRRATGRIGGSGVDRAAQLGKSVERRPPPPPPPPPEAVPVEKLPREDVPPVSEGASRVNMENVLEDRNPQFDAMLSQMVGRIRSKPGGKLEMGEATLVERSKRPMPKLRNTTATTGRYEEWPSPPGTLNVAQIRQIILLHQGKSDDHNGPMGVAQIAERFRVEVSQVQNILQFVALPPENDTKKDNDTD